MELCTVATRSSKLKMLLVTPFWCEEPPSLLPPSVQGLVFLGKACKWQGKRLHSWIKICQACGPFWLFFQSPWRGTASIGTFLVDPHQRGSASSDNRKTACKCLPWPMTHDPVTVLHRKQWRMTTVLLLSFSLMCWEWKLGTILPLNYISKQRWWLSSDR